MQFFKTPNIDFISKRRVAYFISGGLILAGLISLFINHGPNLGIDFRGGTEIVIRFEQPMNIGDLRSVLETGLIGSSEIKSIGTRNEFLIYVKQQRNISTSDVTDNIKDQLAKSMSDIGYEIRKVDTVGPKIGEELRKAMIFAILLALLLILIYVGWRFELIFSVGAIIALFHDVLITLGIFSMLRIEISLKEIAAFLTIVGYSLNDTIVVYDRIRENLKVLRSEELNTIINKSINEVLSRTVITSLTTFIVVLILFLFGGEVLHGFAFAMLVGVVVGTYSSIFVASPLVFEWQARHGGKQRLRMAKKKK